MGKLLFKPHLNSNFARAVYLGILFAIFRFCTDMLFVRYFGAKPTTMTALASLMGMLMFAYLVYLVLELQDVVDKHHPPQGGQDEFADDPHKRA